ncbi:MAG: hypothetical protein ACRDL7_02920 [Gaiellaceae bacterium]
MHNRSESLFKRTTRIDNATLSAERDVLIGTDKSRAVCLHLCNG